MMYRYGYLILLLVAAVCASCKKYLNVVPEDKYTHEQVFSNEFAVQQALNGLYFNLASDSLYGRALTNTAVELMAQRYNVALNLGTARLYQQFQQHVYTDADVMRLFDGVWGSAYATIAKANAFIESLDAVVEDGLIDQDNAELLKGEAIGIRALLHFDVLRLFGPVYATAPTDPAIPYYRRADAEPTAILTASAVLDSISADLLAAKRLLSKDPVINGGVMNEGDFYSGLRNQRVNYYAVSALLARVYLYAGKTDQANQTAKTALQEGERWFPWLPYTDIVNNPSPDRIFSSEVLLGIYNQDMYTNQSALFSPELTNFLTPLQSRLDNVFESNENDYRYLTTWVAGIKDRTFFKFADVTDKTKPWRFIQPLIRKSELYYIIAETEPDAEQARDYLNTVRFNRGLGDLPTDAMLDAEIQKAYEKEFWGEGQLFFYYKRKNRSTIPSAVSATANVFMNVGKYVVPLPFSETTPR